MTSGEARAPRTRVRRERGVAESLLSIVLVLEAAVLFFATLAIRGLTALPTGVVIGGGAVFLVLLVAVSLVQRYPWGIAIGGVLQVAYVALGFLHPFMFVIGAVFAGMWVWCLVRARRIENSRRLAAEGENA
ncbi:MAG: DUF4233 domain-containing protein [Pseudolysinimonas sp.]|uniref:DUF4233 domain-containing protein n=1 Tax=Pseudolysinimonas sp. TaxID=2680009 RepID=UPI0032648B22